MGEVVPKFPEIVLAQGSGDSHAVGGEVHGGGAVMVGPVVGVDFRSIAKTHGRTLGAITSRLAISSRTLYGSSGSIEVSEQCQDDPEWILERMRCYVAV